MERLGPGTVVVAVVVGLEAVQLEFLVLLQVLDLVDLVVPPPEQVEDPAKEGWKLEEPFELEIVLIDHNFVGEDEGALKPKPYRFVPVVGSAMYWFGYLY